MSTLEIRRLKAFGQQVWDDAVRDLQLLRQIATTLDELDIEQERANQLNRTADEFIQKLRSAKGVIPRETGLVDLFNKARDIVGDAHGTLCARLRLARADKRLTEEDGIVIAFENLVESISTLHNNLNSLSWLIGELEADGDSELPGTYSSAKQLFEAMGV